MAPSATAAKTVPGKVKRPIPPGIQTNGINASNSSPSPSMSASRGSTGAKYPPTSATGTAAPTSASGARSANRSRRDTPVQLLGRGQRNTSVGLRSGSVVGELAPPQAAEPQPYSMSMIMPAECSRANCYQSKQMNIYSRNIEATRPP